MEKMKSALEIALEKAQSMEHNIKKEELAAAEQQKYIKAAKMLGRSFLQEKTTKKEIKESIMRYPEKSRAPALNAFLKKITQQMDLANTPLVLQAVTYLKDDPKTWQACAEVEKLYRQYRHKTDEKTAELQKSIDTAMLKKLNREGIKGTALASFNIKHLDQWEKAAAQLHEEYDKILQGFRAEIVKDK